MEHKDADIRCEDCPNGVGCVCRAPVWGSRSRPSVENPVQVSLSARLVCCGGVRHGVQ